MFFRRKQETPPTDSHQNPLIYWGGLELPDNIATSHFLVAGTTGSGKTATINLLLSTVVPRIGRSSRRPLPPAQGWRAFVFDAKIDIISKLRAMGTAPIHILNPFDARCSAWDIAKDFQHARDIQELAALLFPVPKEAREPFFNEAASTIAEGVILSFNARLQGKWTLRDLLLAMGSPERIKEILDWAPEHNADRLKMYFGDERTANNIMSTLANRVARYKVIAGHWHRASNPPVSLEDWVAGESILVLGHSHRSTEALRDINRVIFRRAVQLVLDQPNSNVRRTWFFLDELSKAGKLEALDELLTKGRSKGACVVLGFQDIAGVQEVYGDKITEEILAQVANKAVLRLQGEATVKWAQDAFGYTEEMAQRQSESISFNPGGTGSQSGLTEQKEERAVVLGSEFLAIPSIAEPGISALGGFYSTTGIGAYKWELPLELVRARLGEDKATPDDFHASSPSFGELQPWTEEERDRLGLSPEKPQHTEKPPRTAGTLDGLDVR